MPAPEGNFPNLQLWEIWQIVTLRHFSWGDIWDKWHPDISAKVQWDYNPKQDTELPTIRKIDRGTESDWKKMRGDLQTEPSLAVSFNYLHPLVMHNIWSKTNKLPIASLTLVSIYIHVDNVYITHTNQGHDKRVMLLKGGLFQSLTCDHTEIWFPDVGTQK